MSEHDDTQKAGENIEADVDDILRLVGRDVEDVALLYDQVKELFKGKERGDDTARFEEHVRLVLDKMQERLQGVTDQYLKQAEILAAKHALFDLCLTGAIDHASSLDPALGNVLQGIRSSHSEIVGTLAALPSDMNVFYETEVATLKDRLATADQETQQLLEAAELLEQDSNHFLEEKKAMTEQFKNKELELMDEIRFLKAENDKLQIRLRQSEQAKARLPGVAITALTSPLQLSPTVSSARRRPLSPRSGSPEPGAAQPLSASTASTGSKYVRELSLAKLKDIIEEIYVSKLKFDKKCVENRVPLETMEQHLYTFLNQKYGLKPLILEWATAIITAVKRYQAVDNDVAVFGKILRNEIEERFRRVQTQLKETVTELLKVHLRGKYQLKREDDITQMLKQRMEGYVAEEEWVSIIKYMYNHEDSVELIVKLKDVIRMRQQELIAQKADDPRRLPEDTPPPTNRILYTDFLQVLLDYQLRRHDRFLNKLTKLFRQFDADKNGILSEDEFRQLIIAIDPHKSDHEIAKMLIEADPHSLRQLTFSQCVDYLARELIQAAAGGQQPSL